MGRGGYFSFGGKNAKSTWKNGFNLNNMTKRQRAQKRVDSQGVCGFAVVGSISISRVSLSHSSFRIHNMLLQASRLFCQFHLAASFLLVPLSFFLNFTPFCVFFCPSEQLENKINDFKLDFSFRILAGTCLT